MQLLVAVGCMSRLNPVLGAYFNEQGKDAEIVAFERDDELGRRNVRQLFRPQGLGGCRPDGGGLVFGCRSAARTAAAGDGRCAGRASASRHLKTFAGPDP